MRKEIILNINDYPENTWIELPQDTHIHPKEMEKMFEDDEIDEGREYGAYLTPEGDITLEGYGDKRSIKLTDGRKVSEVKESIFTHSHPNFILQQDLDEGLVTAPPLSPTDLENPEREIRAFSRNTDKKTGQIHSFKHLDKGEELEDFYERKKGGKKLVKQLHHIAEPLRSTKKFNDAMKTYKGFPYSTGLYTEGTFNLGRSGHGKMSVINLEKTNIPGVIKVTKIRTTGEEEPHFDLLQTLPRKKKKSKSLIKRNILNIPKINLNNLNNILVKSKAKHK